MTGPRRLAELTWPEIAGSAATSVLAVPLGATEQHGPHLPFTVDTEVAAALADRLGAVRPWVVVAPAVAYGSSGEHADFPGTLSIGQDATELLLVELVRSADAFAGVLLVCGHGGNADPLRRAVTRLRGEGRRVRVWAPRLSTSDSHAGGAETAAMMALRPAAVRRDRAERGVTRPLDELMPALRASGIRAVSPNGVLGDPTGASAAEGARLLVHWTDALVAAADRWHTIDWPAASPAQQR